MSLDKSLGFQTWEYNAQLPLPYGMVRLHVIRYKPGSPRMLTMSCVREMLNMNRKQIKNLVADIRLDVYKTQDPAVLKRLAEVSAIKPGKEQAYIGRLSNIITLLDQNGAWPLIVKMLKDVAKSEPPASANDMGARRLERATNPLQPLPMLSPSAREDSIDCDPNDISSSDERIPTRKDREPAFISSKPGR